MELPPAGVPWMAQWQAAQTPTWTPAPTTAGPLPAQAHGNRANYVAKAITAEAEAVASTPEGERNAQLYRSAVKLTRLVLAGYTDETAVRAALERAAHTAGLGRRETHRTIASGVRWASQNAAPRDPGPARSAGAAVPELRELTAVPSRDGTAGGAHPPGDTPRTGGAPGPRAHTEERAAVYLRDAVDWLESLDPDEAPVWGPPDAPMWADGEALMLASLPGLGKTTLAGQLVRARLGLQPTVLDMPVTEGHSILYLAMDRPKQIARRLGSMFTETERNALRGTGRWTFGVGPPPADLARAPELLAELCASAKADTVVIDSLKDAVLGLTDDEAAGGWNRARNTALTAGTQVLELHHLVKRGADGKAPAGLADVYGSAWLTAGAGSVLLLSGEAGDPIVKATHVKPVREPWGPADLIHDHGRGITTVHRRLDVATLLATTGAQTVTGAARHLYESEKPSKAEKERARRALEALVAAGKAEKVLRDPETQYRPAGRDWTERRR